MNLALRPALVGFVEPGQGRIDTVSENAFRSACHAAARAVGGAVVEFRVPDVTPTFYLAHITEREAVTAVLCHRAEPYLAFTRPLEADAMSIEFLDNPSLAAAFGDNARFTPLDAGTLDRPLTEADFAGLDPGCLKQLRYWRPKSLGEAMFNWFD